MKTIAQIQKKIEETFTDAFGRTPLSKRLEDIFKESLSLSNAYDLTNMREETGDLLSSVLMLCAENGWNANELVEECLEKINRRKAQYNSLGRKTRVVLLGGAFNPPTIGHFKLAQFVLNASGCFDEAWIVPCNQHMYGKKMASTEDRLNMCRLMSKQDGRIKVCDYEIVNNLAGETYHSVNRLMAEPEMRDKYEFGYIIGMDNANSFDKWFNYEHLVKMMQFVVVSRQGVNRDPNVNWYMSQPHLYLEAETDIPEISSTEVRGMLNKFYRHGGEKFIKSLEESLNSDVLDYIIDKELYKE